MPSEKDELASLAGRIVVLDTSTPYVYIGTLDSWDEYFITLSDCDAHDVSEGRSGKELYVMEARRTGIQKNRNKALVRKAAVVAVTALEDVIAW
jgi:small nuclear ribonucleoprotein (snRNP)-like protein